MKYSIYFPGLFISEYELRFSVATLSSCRSNMV